MSYDLVTISEIIDEISMGPFGSNIKVECFVDDGIPVLNGSNVDTVKLREDNFRFVTPEKADSLGKANAFRGDIVVTHRGTLGQIAIIPTDSKYQRYVISQSQFRMRCNLERVLPEFVVYYFHTREGQYQILSNKSQVGVPALARPTTTFQSLTLPLPSLAVQKKIIQILFCLDDKIELNNRINKNLETQAQAIFKSWFVDFEPFQGGEFVDSEIGKIPKGWRAGTLNDLVESTLGGDWGKEVPLGNYTKEVYCIRGADIPEINKGNKGKMPARYILPKNFASKQLCNNDIVIEISGGSPTQSTGRATLITQFLLERYDKDMVCTNFCKAIKPRAKYSYFIYYLWQYLYNKGVMFSYENGTTGIKNFDINGFLSEETVVIPPCEISEEFLNVIMPYVKLTYSNGQQNQTLSTLRDTLLPKLMSGEIQIPQEV